MKSKNILWLLAGVGMLVFLVIPTFASRGWLHILIVMFFNISYSIGLWVIMRMGYLSFGHAAFVGIGAYTSSILTTTLHVPVFIGFLIGGVFAAAIGFALGTVTLKLRGIYFSIVVFAFTEVLRSIWLAFDVPFGGPDGIWNIPRPSIFGFKFSSHFSFYYLMLFFVVGVFLFLRQMDRSQFGFTCLGVRTRHTELLARTVGIDTNFYKNVSFTISCAICGLAGALYASYLHFMSPFVITFFLSTDLVVYCMVGGVASIFGPAIGAGILTILSEQLLAAGYYRTLIFGVLLLVVIVFLPGGLVSLFKRKR